MLSATAVCRMFPKPKQSIGYTFGSSTSKSFAGPSESKKEPQGLFSNIEENLNGEPSSSTDKEKPGPVFKFQENCFQRQAVPSSFLTYLAHLQKKKKGKSQSPFNLNSSKLSAELATKFECQWRDMEWTEERKKSLMKAISSYLPPCKVVPQARVLLLGPVGSGKSSFISSVQSVFSGRVTNRAMVGTSSSSFTKKLQSFKIHGHLGEEPNGLVLCDAMGMGNAEITGIPLHDILAIIQGHVPEGHRFSPFHPVILSEPESFVRQPGPADQIHCVVFVLNAAQVQSYPKSLSSTIEQLRGHISDLGVHQVAVLTHIDQVCLETAKDVTQVYKSRAIKKTMDKAAAMLGMSTSYIVPVKNYCHELNVDLNTDVLLLSAVDHILQYCDLYFQDNIGQNTERVYH